MLEPKPWRTKKERFAGVLHSMSKETYTRKEKAMFNIGHEDDYVISFANEVRKE